MFACLYIPDFPAAALMRCDAMLRARPLAVLEGEPPLVRVMAMNEAARQAGVELGMTKLQAAALTGLELHQRSLSQEAAAHAALVDCACAFSPKIENAADDTVLLDIAGLERVFGPPAKVARALGQRASAMDLECNIAVAANLEAALHAARGFAGVTVISSREEAQRLGELPVDVLLKEPLAFLEVSSFEFQVSSKNSKRGARNSKLLSSELLDTFDRWGVRTFRALALLPPVAVAERLGQLGVLLQKLARGEGVRALNVTEPPRRFEEAIDLEHPVETLQPLAFLLNRMLEQLCARLEARALATNELRLKLGLEDNGDFQIHPERSEATLPHPSSQVATGFPRCARDVKKHEHHTRLSLPIPLRDAKVLLKLLQLELGANPPSAPVVKLWLQAEPALPQQAQHGLFTPAEPQPERLELMLARIAGIVGRERVGSAELVDAHRADAFRMTRFNAQRRHGSTEKKQPFAVGRWPLAEESIQNSKFKIQNWTTDDRQQRTDDGVLANDQRPTTNGFSSANSSSLAQRIFRLPRTAAVELCEGVPRRVICLGEQGPRGEVTWAAGPWRSSSEWWNGKNKTDCIGAWRREEWDVEIGGALYRLVQKEGEGWAVDGIYD